MSAYWLEHAVVDGRVSDGVVVTHQDGVITAVDDSPQPRRQDAVLRGLVLPGIANTHSHAFHRALRGRTHDGGGDFWTWRQQMYRVALRLDPDRYHALARALFAELLLAGYTAVGEFHYVHRDPTTVMADALVDAAREAGIRLTLLDTLYRHGGRDTDGRPVAPAPAQRGFVLDTDTWLARHDAIAVGGTAASATVRRGAAVHSLRAVDPADVTRLVEATGDEPLHAHVSEQPGENAQVRAAFGGSPVSVLGEAGALGARFTAVHATHLDDADVAALAGSSVAICPTTERDLGDGIGPTRRLADAGARIVIGSDQHVVVDPFDELRALDGHERLRSLTRGVFTPAELLAAATVDGYASIGWSGGIRIGAVCDLVALDLGSTRTAGTLRDQAWLAASAADVTDVVVGGRRVVEAGAHPLGDVGALLADAIAAIEEVDA
jgi:formiminoglutamate deiminase